MKKSNQKYIWIGAVVILAFVVFFLFGLQQAVLGVSETIDFGDFENEFTLDDGQTGLGISEGFITLPANTTEFSFTVKYSLKTLYKISTVGSANVKYEIYNYQTNAWETIHDRSWSISGCSTCTNSIDMDGATVYQTGIPEHLVANLVVASPATYDRDYGCLNGMTVQEAKELSLWVEGTSTYRYYCIYPNEYVKSFSVKDASDNYDYEYFPNLITKNQNYINSDNKAKLRITYNPTSSGFRRMDASDFRINFWNVQTPKINVYFLNGTSCSSELKFTYQIQSTDFFSLNECEYKNSLIECYLPEHCTSGYECQSNKCVLNEAPITGDVISPPEKESNFPMFFMYSLIIIAVLGVVIAVVIRRRR